MNILMKAAARAVAGAILCAFVTGAAASDPSPCDRACLRAIAETYLTAMLAHAPSKAPLALNARYTENGVDLSLPDGLWRTLDKLGTYRLYVADPQDRMIGFLAKGLENGAPVLVGTRLRVINHQITEMESVVARLSNTTGGALLRAAPKNVSIDGEPRKPFVTDLPVAARLTAAQLGAIVNGYYTGLEGNRGEQPPAFAADCRRLENETATTNNPVAADAPAGAGNLSCAKAFAQGYYREDTRIRNRRILAVDTERGLVYAGCFFDHDATVRSYRLKDGREFKVRNTGPWTWMTHEIFQIDASGKISQVEAVLLSVPYGMRPGWATGAHLPSPQARQDHFREY